MSFLRLSHCIIVFLRCPAAIEGPLVPATYSIILMDSGGMFRFEECARVIDVFRPFVWSVVFNSKILAQDIGLLAPLHCDI